MNDIDYKFYEELLKRESGLIITPEKVYLLESRLMPVAAKFGLQGLSGIAARLRLARDAELQRAVVEAMTTNETSFFRDNTPFQRLKADILPFFMKNRPSKTLRIWSAACSSGQEPYSIAMTLREMAPQLAGWRFEIVATDLSADILAQAKAGIYSQFEVQRGLPIQMLMKHFDQLPDSRWQIKPDIRDMVTFRTANLLQDLSLMGQFDIVFCRNVLIYFDVPTKAKVLNTIRAQLRPDGVLLLGGAETVIGISDSFKSLPDVKGVYIRNDGTFAPVASAMAAK
jgi:chemotaxis protein methyltransferase CheR